MSFAGPYKHTISVGDTIIIQIGHGKQKALIVTEGHQFQNEFGIFKHNDLIGRPFGIKWKSHNPTNGEKFLYVLHPTPELWTNVLSHRTQIIYSMDAAFISLALNIKPGSFVIESGTGSGSLSHHFIRTIAPTGHLYTFEFHKERQLEAQKEFNIHQISNYVTAFHCDAYHDGFIKCPVLVNAVFLDLPNPWKAVSHAKAALKTNETTRICTFSPCIEQIQATVKELTLEGFTDLFMVEVLERKYISKQPIELPDGRQVPIILPDTDAKTHTSYLLFASLHSRL